MATKLIYPALENYQRKWRQFSVDKNLKDEWLIQLNNLILFYPVNVCEGHATCEDQYPVIVLMSKDCLSKDLERTIRAENILEVLNKLINPLTTFKLSCVYGISNDPDNFYSKSYVKLSLCRDEPRQSLDFTENDAIWFEKAIEAIKQIDMHLKNMIQ